MRAVKHFKDFVKEGIAKTQATDKSRAAFLLQEAEQNYAVLADLQKIMPVSDKNANLFIKSSYDILLEVIRAKMLLEGYNAAGQGAHESEVSYLRVLGFNEKDVQFADQLRYFRNGILYYGTILDKEYAEKVLEFTHRLYPKLLSKIQHL